MTLLTALPAAYSVAHGIADLSMTATLLILAVYFFRISPDRQPSRKENLYWALALLLTTGTGLAASAARLIFNL